MAEMTHPAAELDVLQQFKDYLNKMKQYEQVTSLLYWDMQTKCPPKGIDNKVEALSFFSTESFRLSTAPEYGKMLEVLSAPEVFQTLEPAMQVTVKRYYRDYQRFCRIPEDFYTEYVETTARSENAWQAAKRAKDFSLFAPHLEKVISMVKQYVAYEEPGKEPYEVLLDKYEEGMDTAAIDRIFGELKEGLLPLLHKINAAPKPDLSVLDGCYDVEAQKKVERMLLSYMGFDLAAGTTGETEHPFTMGLGFGDTRVTNHFREDMPLSSIFSAIHEGGHALYEQHVPKEYYGTALSELNQMGLHESQSRFYENILGRKISFWKPIYDKLGELLPKFREIPLDTFYLAINDVHPSMIRVEADEVTYCLHIILRYEMERAIFFDNVPVEELPALWNQKMEELLGICPADDAEGILQDTHWSGAMFGYFPSYLLGSIYDGMFLEQIEKELGNLDEILEKGEILKITDWLKENIHKHGSLYTSKEVIERLCGCPVSAKPLLRYFTEKYHKIYRLS